MSEPQSLKLSLYHHGFCFFCSRVIRTIKQQKLAVESKNVWQDEAALSELRQATGRTTVPILRIESSQGEVSWMPESNDIVRYLKSL